MNGRSSGIDILMGCRPGETMYVLGNGPSLDIEWMRSLPPSQCIGTNRILLHDYEPKYLVIVDHEVWGDQKKAVFGTQCILLVGRDLYEQADDLPISRTLCFDYPHDIAPDLARPELHHGWLTGYYAAAIAARMVKPGGTVVLAGMDLRYPDEGPDHSYGDGFVYGCRGLRFGDAVESFVKLREAARGQVALVVAGESALKNRLFEDFSP